MAALHDCLLARLVGSCNVSYPLSGGTVVLTKDGCAAREGSRPECLGHNSRSSYVPESALSCSESKLMSNQDCARYRFNEALKPTRLCLVSCYSKPAAAPPRVTPGVDRRQ